MIDSSLDLSSSIISAWFSCDSSARASDSVIDAVAETSGRNFCTGFGRFSLSSEELSSTGLFFASCWSASGRPAANHWRTVDSPTLRFLAIFLVMVPASFIFQAAAISSAGSSGALANASSSHVCCPSLFSSLNHVTSSVGSLRNISVQGLSSIAFFSSLVSRFPSVGLPSTAKSLLPTLS